MAEDYWERERLEAQAYAESQALKATKPSSRGQLISVLGTSPALTGRIPDRDKGGPQALMTRAREGGSTYASWKNYADTLTTAWINNAGTLPFHWMVGLSDRDLQYIGGAQSEAIIAARNDVLAQREAETLAELARERTAQQYVSFEEAAAAASQRQREQFTGADGKLSAGEAFEVLGSDETPGQTALNLSGYVNDTPEERYERIKGWLDTNWDGTGPAPSYWAYHFAPDGLNTFAADAMGVVGTAFGGVVDLISGVHLALTGLGDLLVEGTWNGAGMQHQIESARQNAQEEYDAMQLSGQISDYWGDNLWDITGVVGPDGVPLIHEARAEAAAPVIIWDQYKQGDPDGAAEFLAWAGLGDETMAANLLFQLMRDSDEVKTAVDDLNKAMSEEEWNMIQELREPDLGENVRQTIATYGEWVESNATYLAALMGEAADEFFAGRDTNLLNADSWQKVHQEAIKARDSGESVSQYLEVDGTLMGVGIDLLALGVADPISWTGIPRLGLFAAKTFKAAKINKWVDGPAGKAFLDDAIRTARSTQRSDLGSMIFLDELDAVGMGDEFYDLVGGRSRTLPRGSWQRRKGGATEVEVDKLQDNLLGQRTRATPSDPDRLAKLRENGLDEAVVIEVNTAHGTAWVSPDSRQLLEDVAEIGESSVPIVLKEVSTTPHPKVDYVATFDQIGWKKREANPDGWLSVQNTVPENQIYGDVDVEGAKEILRRAALLGAGMGQGGKNVVTSIAMSREIPATFERILAGKGSWADMRRWFSRDNTVTNFTWTGGNYARQVRHTILRMFGDDPATATQLLQEFRDMMRGRAARSRSARTTQGKIATVQNRIKQFDEKGATVTGAHNYKALNDDTLRDVELARYGRDGFQGQAAPPHEADIAGSFRPRYQSKVSGEEFGTQAEFQGLRLTQQPAFGGKSGREFMWFDDSGNIVAGFRYFDDGGGAMWIHPDYRGSGLLEETIEAVRRSKNTGGQREVRKMLHAWTQDPSQTAAGAKALQRIIKKELGDDLDSLADNAVAYDTARAAKAVEADETVTLEALKRLEKELIEELRGAEHLVDNRELNQFMQRLWEKFNRERIAPTGYYDVDVDGLVSWDQLRPGSRSGKYQTLNNGEVVYIPPEIQAELAAAGKKVENLSMEEFAQLLGPLRNPQGWNAPLSVLDLHAARTFGYKKFLEYKANVAFDFVREVSWGALRMWKMDKVYRPATAIVATFDELFRFFQTFGADSWFRWMEDKVRGFSEYGIAAWESRQLPRGTRTKHVLNRDVDHKFGRWARRKQELADNTPQQLRAQNRYFEETYGEGFGVIEPGEPEYMAAAERWTSQALGDSGFRSALISREAFDQWWTNAPEAAVMKRGTVRKADGSTIPVALAQDEVYNGYLNFFDAVFLRGARRQGRTEDAMRAWAKAASDIEAAGQTATRVTLPQWILRDLGPITGVRRTNLGNPIQKANNWMMDQLFLHPARYRQQFMSAQIRRYEELRLRTLYKDQGITIIPDHALEVATSGRYSINRHTQEWGEIERIAREFNVVPESWVRRLAENKAVEEAEHLMYSWHKTSRMGRSLAGQAAIPFGGPWADMWGYYARETLQPAVARGFLGKMGLPGRAAQTVIQSSRGLKPVATISKLAATDFNVDELWNGGPAVDFSPFFFLPTEDESPFMTLLPGFGAIPMILLDTVIRALADPMEEPERHQFIIDQVSELIPAAGFAQRGAGRVFGGGHVSTILKIGSDVSAAFGGGYLTPLHNIVGDITAEVEATRYMRAAFADSDNWDDLINSKSGEEFAMNYEYFTQDAFRRASVGHGLETLGRQLVPARADFDTSGDEVMQVWLNAAKLNSDLAPAGFDQVDLEDPEAAAELADTIRNRFWDLPQDERDLLVLAQPSLAVNMVGGWEWTDKAKAELGLEAGVPYRSQGGQEGLALHKNYITEGYIRPLSPGLLGSLIVGTYFSTRERVAKRAYELTVKDRNEWAWENQMSEAEREWWNGFAESFPLEYKLANKDGFSLWQSWGALQDDYLEGWMEATGADYSDPDERAKYRESKSWPRPTVDAWSTVWRGLDDENFAKRFREQQLPGITDEVADLFDALGIPKVEQEAMTGEQLLSIIHQSLSNDVVSNPAKVVTLANYNTYLNTRSQATLAAVDILETAKINYDFTEEYRQNTVDLLDIHEQNQQLRNELGFVPPDRQRLLRDKWEELRISGGDTELEFDTVWDDMFRRDYGPQDWTVPEPPEDLSRAVPVERVRAVVDGDTVVVQLEGDDVYHKVRLLGVDAYEMNQPQGPEQQERLKSAIMSAVDNGQRIQFVTDPRQTGGNQTDAYGRLLAWLFIDGRPYYFPDEVRP